MTAPLDLAAFMAFIRGVDIPNTIEQARVALVERALKAETELARYRDPGPSGVLTAAGRRLADENHHLRRIIGKYLDNHCTNADAEGMSALCECRLCLEARALLWPDSPALTR